MFYEIISIVVVSILWGATNPFIKRGTKDIVKIESTNVFEKFLLEIKYLITNFQYLIPMALNQLGSVLYFITLQYLDLSFVVPITNSLTFIFTGITGQLLGEKPASKYTYVGIFFILMGTCLCCYDKYLVNNT